MNPYIRLESLTHWPDWHKKPLHLSTPEMDDPWLAIENFFTIYHLDNIRRYLEQLLEASLEAEEPDIRSNHYNVKNLHRLTEAVWLLYLKRREEQQQDIEEEGKEEPEETKEAETSFIKSPRLILLAKQRPLHSLQELFKNDHLTLLKKELNYWLKIALSSDAECYSAPAQRAALITFCARMRRLFEAAYVITRIHTERERRGVDITEFLYLLSNLMVEEKLEYLDFNEIHEPLGVIKNFFSRFSPSYCRSQLWDLFGAIIISKSKRLDRATILQSFENFLTLIEASWSHIRASEKESPDEEDG